MAPIVTSLGEGKYLVELSDLELSWLTLVSDWCHWSNCATLATAVEKGLAELVVRAQTIETESEREPEGEVTG